MAIKVQIVDGTGTGKHLKVNGEGEVPVSIHTHPPTNEDVVLYPFSQWFTADGASSGSNDMRVNGGTTPQEFYIKAQPEKDIFIKSISIKIADASSVLNKFGNLTALTNGLSWTFRNDALGEVTIQDAMKQNIDVIRIGLATPGIGGTDAFKADLSGAGADTYFSVIDLAQTFGFPWGLRLKSGTNDRMSFFVNDDLSTGMDELNIKAYGTQL